MGQRLMYRTHFDKRRSLHPNVGLPHEHGDDEINDWALKALVKREDVQRLIASDDMPIPAPADRENYYGDRHLEFWLSGFATAQTLAEIYPRLLNEQVRVLDFGGATGRVSRHLTQANSHAEVWLTDINVNWIAWLDRYFNRPLRCFQNRLIPVLPIEDNYFDFIFALSVFTHLDTDEIPWLLELRRILKPGGLLYVTVLDDAVWASLRNPGHKWLRDSLLRGQSDETFETAIDAGHGIPDNRYVLTYSDAEGYNVNVFLGREWILRKWGAFFTEVVLSDPMGSETQSRVVLCK